MQIRRLTLGLIAATSLWSGLATAGADFCARLVKAPTVSLDLAKPIRRYRHDQSIEDLTAQAKRTGTPVADGGMVTGLTSEVHRLKVKAWFSVAQVPDGFCVSPQALVQLSDRQVTVSLPREIPSNSCFFQATVEHEHKHARIAEDGMDRIVQEEVASIQREFQGQYGYYQNLKNAQSRIDQLRASIERRMQLALDRVEQMNGGVDTPQEYARVQSVCKDRPIPKKSLWEKWFG